MSGRSKEPFVKKDPYAGLSANRPIRAFVVLSYHAKQSDYPTREWQTFLESDARKNDKTRLMVHIAERICSYPDDVVSTIIQPSSNWLLSVSKQLATNNLEVFERIVSKLIRVLGKHSEEGKSVIVRGDKAPDWPTEAINAPVGTLAEVLLNDPRIKNVNSDTGFPGKWIECVGGLLSLSGDLRRHALVIIGQRLGWFYHIDPSWTEL